MMTIIYIVVFLIVVFVLCKILIGLFKFAMAIAIRALVFGLLTKSSVLLFDLLK
jgi:hypothetical protein